MFVRGPTPNHLRITVFRRGSTLARNDEQHLIADFQAGKDVGLGMFGDKNATSVFSLGIRYAQFSNKTNISLKSDPDWHFHLKYIYGATFAQQAFHTNRASLTAERSFHGIGPTLSWDASLPFAGNSRDGELSFNGGVNAAVLFGRQRTTIDHQMSRQYCPPQVVPISPSGAGIAYVTYQPPAVHHTRVRTVVVPNVGGFVGATFRIENFKVSAGYRADLFFGAMDGGIDAARKENVGFYGPFATVSVGIGG
jgi:iron complex outermembrane receptor protein